MAQHTLTDIDAAFDALSPEHKLLLIDRLAERAGVDATEALQTAAFDYATTVYTHSDRAFEFADSIYPQGQCLPETWRLHRAVRDRTLSYALRDKPKGLAA